MITLHSSQLLWIDCGFPRGSICLTMPNAILFYFLFRDFYKKSYVLKNEKQIIDKSPQQNTLNDEDNSNNNDTSKEEDMNKKQT